MYDSFTVAFRDNTIYYAGRTESIGELCRSLLNHFDVQKVEAALEEKNHIIMRCGTALKFGDDVRTVLPKAYEAVIDTLDILKEIKPFDRMDRTAISKLFSEEAATKIEAYFNNSMDPNEAYEGRVIASEILDLLKFYETLYDDVPRAYYKIHRIAERFSEVDWHEKRFLFSVACNEGNTPPNAKITYSTTIKPKEKRVLIGKHLSFKSYTDLVTTELFEGLLLGHYPRLCACCGKAYIMTSERDQKYCNGMSNYTTRKGKKLSCRQYAKMKKKPENSADDPYKVIYTKRCDVLRTEKNRRKITPEFAAMARLVAKDHLELALFDPEYAETQYASDMERDALYAETEKRLQRCRLTA